MYAQRTEVSKSPEFTFITKNGDKENSLAIRKIVAIMSRLV